MEDFWCLIETRLLRAAWDASVARLTDFEGVRKSDQVLWNICGTYVGHMWKVLS